MLLKYLLYISVILTFSSANITLEKNSNKTSLLENSFIFIDKTSRLNFEEIQNTKFEKSNTDYIRLGYTADTLWIKFKIKNNSNEKITRYLTLTNPMIDTIELYTKKNNTYNKETQGVLHLDKYDRNNILHPTFKIIFKANETKEFYYKTYSISSANYLKLYLKDHKQLYKDEFSYQLIETLFFGAMIAFIIYNFFIFLFTKEKVYFYYIIFILFITVNHSSYSILLSYLIIDEKYIHIDAFLAIYYLSLATIFSLLFIRTILDIHKYKILNTLLNILIFANILLILLSTTESYLIEYGTYLMFLSMLFVAYLSYYSYRKKHPIINYILPAWIINVIGLMSLAFKQYGIPNLIDYFPYFYEFSCFAEATLFSIALASKLNKTKELENSLKTNQILIREIHHRVKNNMQFIILMYRLKLSSLSNQQIDNKLKEVEGSIQAISQTHEILYNQENLDSINTSVYFQTLINELKKGFKTKDINILLNISTSLDVEKSIFCGIILNEIITNSFKYAFTENKGEINISLEKTNNKYIFIIHDNGIGFDYEKEKNSSFGLSFVQAMVKDELKGNISFSNLNGTKIMIEF